MFGKKNDKMKEYTECCALCENASEADDGKLVCSRKNGLDVSGDGVCRRFSYDLLKKKPEPKPKKFTLDDL